MKINKGNTETVIRPETNERPVSSASAALLNEETRPYFYTGKVELEVTFPVDLRMVAELYDTIQKNPEIKIINTRGTFNRGFFVTLLLDKPLPLIHTLSSKLTEADVKPSGIRFTSLDADNSVMPNLTRQTDQKNIILTSKRN